MRFVLPGPARGTHAGRIACRFSRTSINSCLRAVGDSRRASTCSKDSMLSDQTPPLGWRNTRSPKEISLCGTGISNRRLVSCGLTNPRNSANPSGGSSRQASTAARWGIALPEYRSVVESLRVPRLRLHEHRRHTRRGRLGRRRVVSVSWSGIEGGSTSSSGSSDTHRHRLAAQNIGPASTR